MTPGTPGLVTRCLCKDSRMQEEGPRQTRSTGLGCNVCGEYSKRRSQVRVLVGKFNKWVICSSVSGV